MRGWLRLLHFVIINEVLNHYLNGMVHSFDYEVDDLCCLVDRQEDSLQINPTLLDLSQSYYCNEFDLLLAYDLTLLVVVLSFCFMSMVRPRRQLVISSSTLVSFLISDASITPMVPVFRFADSHIIRNSIALKDSITLN